VFFGVWQRQWQSLEKARQEMGGKLVFVMFDHVKHFCIPAINIEPRIDFPTRTCPSSYKLEQSAA
jgi:hypothetical protein